MNNQINKKANSQVISKKAVRDLTAQPNRIRLRHLIKR